MRSGVSREVSSNHSRGRRRRRPHHREGTALRTTLIVVSTLFLLTGAIWILQGINVLPGSFMTGQIQWAYAGIVTALVGGGLLWTALRMGRAEDPKSGT
jgi:uncharacterized integral membrane protein